MRKQIQRLVTLGMVACLSAASSMIAFAGQWQQTGTQWKYQNDDGTYATSGWQWIDGNNDNVAECYYFGADSVMLENTTTPDGYSVNDSGMWVVDGNVQTKSVENSADNGSIRLKTDFIKQEFIDCYGKDKDYIISVFGEPRTSYAIQIPDKKKVTESHQLFYKDIIVVVRDNRVEEIRSVSGNKYALFNVTKNEYTIEELDNSLGVKSEEEYSWYTWQLMDNPSISLEYMGRYFVLYFD